MAKKPPNIGKIKIFQLINGDLIISIFTLKKNGDYVFTRPLRITQQNFMDAQKNLLTAFCFQRYIENSKEDVYDISKNFVMSATEPDIYILQKYKEYTWKTNKNSYKEFTQEEFYKNFAEFEEGDGDLLDEIYPESLLNDEWKPENRMKQFFDEEENGKDDKDNDKDNDKDSKDKIPKKK